MRLTWYGRFGYCGTDPYSAAGQSLIMHVTKEEINNEKSIRRSEPVFSLWESLLVLAGILGLLGFLIIIEHQEPQAPLLIAFVLLMVYGRLRGFSWNTIMAGVRTGCGLGSIRW